MAFADTADDNQQEVKPTETPEGQPAVETLDNGNIIVGGKEFSPAEAVKKIENADKHIETLESENAEKDEQTLKLLERIEALEGKIKSKAEVDEVLNAANQPAPEPASTQEISKDELVAAAVDQIKAQELAAVQEANFKTIVSEARELYGDEFGPKIDELAESYGMAEDAVVQMARNTPKVFRQIFLPTPKEEEAPTPPTDTTGSTKQGTAGLDTAPAPQKRSFLGMSVKDRTEEIQRRMAALSGN